MSDIQIHSCGSGAAHQPHPSRLLGGWWCAGIMPIWPCALRRDHYPHLMNDERFYCPGSLAPPRNMTGPGYPTQDVCDAIDTYAEISEDSEEIEQ